MSKAHEAPRCTANSKRTGERCKGPAVKGWSVCRFHGARGGHSAGTDHPCWRHGMRSREWTETRAKTNQLVREAKEIERILSCNDLAQKL